MDRNDRSKLMMKTRSFSESALKLCTEYLNFLSDLQTNEQDKMENIPKAFENSSLSDKLSDGIDSIQQVTETIEEISDLISEVPDTLNITMRKAAKHRSIPVETTLTIIPNEKRTKRIQIIVTPSLNQALRDVSESTRISMNEIINALLVKNLQSIIA